MALKIPVYWMFVTVFFITAIHQWIGSIGAVFDPVAMALVLAPLPALLLSQLGVKGTMRFFARLTAGRPEDEDVRVVNLLMSCAFLYSGVGIVAGNIQVLRNLSNSASIGHGIASAFMCLVYGLIVPVYLLPFMNAVGAKSLVRRASMFVLLIVPSLIGLTYFTLSITRVVEI